MVSELSTKPITPPERKIGDFWSRQFADMMNVFFGVHKFDKAPSPIITLPNGKKIILADILLLEKGVGQYYCEIKHKSPTSYNCYGLEEYRFKSLISLQEWITGTVLYVIHNHSLNGGVTCKANNLAHWFCCEVRMLQSAKHETYPGLSLVCGVRKTVPIFYWKINNWVPLKDYFKRVWGNAEV